jgi:hypothetical protein
MLTVVNSHQQQQQQRKNQRRRCSSSVVHSHAKRRNVNVNVKNSQQDSIAIFCPKELIGDVIGKKGSTIRALEEFGGVKINIAPETTTHTNSTTGVSVHGITIQVIILDASALKVPTQWIVKRRTQCLTMIRDMCQGYVYHTSIGKLRKFADQYPLRSGKSCPEEYIQGEGFLPAVQPSKPALSSVLPDISWSSIVIATQEQKADDSQGQGQGQGQHQHTLSIGGGDTTHNDIANHYTTIFPPVSSSSSSSLDMDGLVKMYMQYVPALQDERDQKNDVLLTHHQHPHPHTHPHTHPHQQVHPHHHQHPHPHPTLTTHHTPSHFLTSPPYTYPHPLKDMTVNNNNNNNEYEYDVNVENVVRTMTESVLYGYFS